MLCQLTGFFLLPIVLASGLNVSLDSDPALRTGENSTGILPTTERNPKEKSSKSFENVPFGEKITGNISKGRGENFEREKFIQSEKELVAKKPNLRILEEINEVPVLPGLGLESADKVSKKNSSTEQPISDIPTEDRKSLEGPSTIRETSTLPTTEGTSKPSKKKSAKRFKGSQKLGKVREGSSSRKKSKKKLAKPKGRNNTIVGETRRSSFPGRPVVYSEKSGTTNQTTKKYQGIDRKPTAVLPLKNLRTRPEMELLHYDTTIRSRYVRTTVTGVVKNYDQTTLININEIVPRNALITKFTTEINGQKIKSTVRDKKSTMDLPKNSANGLNVGTILVETRDCDAVSLAVKVPSDSTLTYAIVYEYLLERNLEVYSVPVTIHNNMWISNLLVRWRIQEERNLTRLETPIIYRTTALPAENSDDSTVCLVSEEPGIAELIWEPTISEQKNISRRLGELSKNGVVGILELRYDVMHDQDPCGQVVRQDGYFAQFFSAPNQPSLTKHVVFVLDVSDSMQGDPIKQLKTAMYFILDTLQPIDNFTLINFSDEVNIMNIYDRSRDTVYRGVGVGPDGRGKKSGKTEWPGTLATYEATASNIEAAKEAVKNMELRVFTNIYDALVMGFKAVKDMATLPPAQSGQPHPEPLIVFLTDGHASDGPSYDHNVILKMVKDQNRNAKATMFALGFGGEADMELLRRFALATSGIEKHIYKDIDAADQLVTFFQSIKAPVLKDLYFKYDPKQVITSTLTGQSFSMIHRGKEVTIAGKLDPAYPSKSSLHVDMTALGRYAEITCQRSVEESGKMEDYSLTEIFSNATSVRRGAMWERSRRWKSAGTVEKIWAFKMLSHLRDEIELDHWRTHQNSRCDDARKPIERMLEICLRLNYAMPAVTNLVYDGSVIERFSISPEKGEAEGSPQIDPLAKFSWIVKLRDKNGIAKLPITNRRKARMYAHLSLGVSENPPQTPKMCARSIDDSPGECRYLPECPDPRILGTPGKFRKYFCRLGSYAGVCCSKSMQRMDNTA